MKNVLIGWIFVLAFPYPFLALAYKDILGVGLIWMAIHHAYYIPLSWVNGSIFPYDGDLGFWVTNSARVLGAIVYSAIYFVLTRYVRHKRQMKSQFSK